MCLVKISRRNTRSVSGSNGNIFFFSKFIYSKKFRNQYYHLQNTIPECTSHCFPDGPCILINYRKHNFYEGKYAISPNEK